MTENSAPTTTLPPEGPPAPYVEAPKQPRARRTLALPVVAAIAVATLLIGGLAGGIIGYAVHSDGPGDNGREGGPGQRFQQGGPGNGNGPQPPSGQQGQQQDGSAG